MKYPSGSKVSEIIASIVRDIEAGKDLPSFIWFDPQRTSIVLDEYYEAKAQVIVRTVNEEIPKYKAKLETLPNGALNLPELGASMEPAEMIRFMLKVQQRYLADVMKNIDRLHPVTREEIKRVEITLRKSLAMTE